MANILVTLMSQLTTLTEEETASIEESFPIRTFGKGTFLLKEGEVAEDAYFIVAGCIRNYELLDGEEKTLDFYTENQTVANFDSLSNGTGSLQNYVCVEDTTVAVINAKKENELYVKHPRFETFCRTGMEQMMGSQQQEFLLFAKMTPEERYLHLLDTRPDLAGRVPQYQLASYLGLKPESLSRIRKRILEKKL